MARRASYTVIPTIPQQGLTEWEYRTLSAMRENLELLTGVRSGAQGAAAVTRGSISVAAPPATLQRVTAEGVGYTINNVTVPSLEDYVKLINNVQQLTNDVATLRQVVAGLITQLKGQP